MSLVKIGDIKPPCMNPSHNPPMHIVLSPGVYEHTCPGCGAKQRFTVAGPYWSTTHNPFSWGNKTTCFAGL